MATASHELPTIGLLRKRKRGTAAGKKNSEPKRVTKKQRTASEDDDLDLSIKVNRSFAYMDSRLLADYMAQRMRKFENDLSPVELEDRYIPGNYSMIPLLVIST
jgi:protein CMS1